MGAPMAMLGIGWNAIPHLPGLGNTRVSHVGMELSGVVGIRFLRYV